MLAVHRRLPVLAVAAGVMCVGARAEGQGPVEIRILYQPSGLPLPVLFISHGGDVIRADADRILRLDMGPADSVAIGVQCPPGRRIFTRWIGDVRVRLDERDGIAYGYLPDGVCREPPEEVRTVEVRGRYVRGFEWSELLPCEPFQDLHETMYDGIPQAAWIDFERMPGLSEPDSVWTDVGGYRYAMWFIRARGDLRGPGGYGHMGGSLYSFEPDSLLDVRAPAPDDCEAEPGER